MGEAMEDVGHILEAQKAASKARLVSVQNTHNL